MQNSWIHRFVVIYFGQAFSLLGSSAVQFAVIWWLTLHTESAVTLTIASVIAYLPMIVIGPFAGVWIDRFNRRTVMIAADGFVALGSAALGVVFLLDATPSVAFIYVALLLRGVGSTFHTPALQAAIPQFVPASELTRVGGWANMAVSLSNLVGPVLGGLLIAALPMAPIMLVDIAGAAFAIVCLLFVRLPDVAPSTASASAAAGDGSAHEGSVRGGATAQILRDMASGLRVMRANRAFMAAFWPVMVMTILYMPLSSLFPLLVKVHFEGGAWHNSVVEFVFAAGLVASSMVVGIVGIKKKRFVVMSLGIAVLGIACAVGGALPAEGFIGFVACCFVMGASGTFINIPYMAYIQESFEAGVLGKVMSMSFAAMSAAMPVGLLVAGPVSDAIGVDQWFLWSGVLLVATAVFSWWRTRRYGDVSSVASGNSLSA